MMVSLCHHQIRRVSQAVIDGLKIIPQETLVWRSNESDPRKHTTAHEGLFYELPGDKQILSIFGQPSPFDLETARYYKVLGLTPIMIRRPALDAMNYIKKVTQRGDLPNVRLLFYGDKGNGKTHTLTHLVHYLHSTNDYFIFQVREMKKFTRSPWETASSSSRTGRIDTPMNAAIQLQQFRIQNASLLEKHKDTLVCSKDYHWSSREATKQGEPLINITEHGVNRVIHASDCLAVLLKELCLSADQGKIKLASVLDNVKFLFEERAGVLKHQDAKKMLVDEITVARALKKLIKGVHKNSIVIATCDDKLSRKQNQTPKDVIGLEGWNHFDPCLPIHVGPYNRKEFESCMNLYQDIGWLTRPVSRTEEVRNEIRYVSGLNPKQVELLSRSL